MAAELSVSLIGVLAGPLAERLARWLSRKGHARGEREVLRKAIADQIDEAAKHLKQISPPAYREIDAIRRKRTEIANELVDRISAGDLDSKSKLMEAFLSSIESVGIKAPKDRVSVLSDLIYDELARTLIASPDLVGEIVSREKERALSREPSLEPHPEIAKVFDDALRAIQEISAKKTIDELPRPYARRVFVGGSYDDLPDLREIERHIVQCGYLPVVAYDFKLPTDNSTQLMNTHDMDMLLIHSCRHIVFELTHPAGQYDEVEWAIRTFSKPTLGLCKTRDPGVPRPSQISTMVRDLFEQHRQPLKYYADFREIRRIIEDFLSINR